MDWIVPDGQNKRLREHGNKAMADTTLPDGGPAMYIDLQSLGPYFSSHNFMIDMRTGQIFVLHKRRWIRTGLNCTQSIYPIEELGREIQEASNAYWTKLREANETSLEKLTKFVKRTQHAGNQQKTAPTPRYVPTAQPPPLPRIDNPNLYTIHEEPMPLHIRRTYICDRTRNVHTYIMEYSSTLEMQKEKRYDSDELWSRLRIVFGRANTVKEKIDASLAKDDDLRRRKGLTNFRSPYRFPDPAEMHNSTPQTWIQWISREANELCNELTEVMDQKANETTIEFRPIPVDEEADENVNQDNNLMQFETPRLSPQNEVEERGKGVPIPRESDNGNPNTDREATTPTVDPMAESRTEVRQTEESRGNTNINPRIEENEEGIDISGTQATGGTNKELVQTPERKNDRTLIVSTTKHQMQKDKRSENSRRSNTLQAEQQSKVQRQPRNRNTRRNILDNNSVPTTHWESQDVHVWNTRQTIADFNPGHQDWNVPHNTTSYMGLPTTNIRQRNCRIQIVHYPTSHSKSS